MFKRIRWREVCHSSFVEIHILVGSGDRVVKKEESLGGLKVMERDFEFQD